MTELLFRKDPYLRSCQAKAIRVDEDGVKLDKTVFFAAGGGQPGDTGVLHIGEQQVQVTNTVLSGENKIICHVVDQKVEQGADLIAMVDWNRRHLIMRTHTALHLLYAAVKLRVTGGRMDPGRGRLDFDMPEPPDKEEIQERIASFVKADAAVSTRWVGRDYLDENPDLVKTMAVKPPANQSSISLVEIEDIDIQACGGTHVRSTSEVGLVKVTKIEKKGRLNRRIIIEVDYE